MWLKTLCPNTRCDPHVAPSGDHRQQVHLDGTVLWDSPLTEEPALWSVTAPPVKLSAQGTLIHVGSETCSDVDRGSPTNHDSALDPEPAESVRTPVD